MPHPIKTFFHNKVTFITTRTEEGLPFVPNDLMNLVLKGVLARAQELFPVRICHFIFMANHFHLLLWIDNPEDIPRFMERVKTESSHLVNRLMGRRQRTVWVDGYDSPIELDKEGVIERIIYMYTNPQSAHLVETIDDYPGLSSWSMFCEGLKEIDCIKVPRTAIKALKKATFQDQYEEISQDTSLQHSQLTLTPNAWMLSFGILENEVTKVNESIINSVLAREEALIIDRLATKQRIVGKQVLLSQPVNKPYTPTKFGKRMLCHAANREIRADFIALVKALRDKAREVLLRWRQGDRLAQFPSGLFPPSFPLLIQPLW